MVQPPFADKSPGFESHLPCKAAVPPNNGAADAGCIWEGGRGAQHRLMGHLQIFFLKNL